MDKFKLDQDFDAAKAAALESLPKVPRNYKKYSASRLSPSDSFSCFIYHYE